MARGRNHQLIIPRRLQEKGEHRLKGPARAGIGVRTATPYLDQQLTNRGKRRAISAAPSEGKSPRPAPLKKGIGICPS